MSKTNLLSGVPGHQSYLPYPGYATDSDQAIVTAHACCGRKFWRDRNYYNELCHVNAVNRNYDVIEIKKCVKYR